MRAEHDRHPTLDRHGENGQARVVHVLADEIDPPRRPRDVGRSRTTERTDESRVGLFRPLRVEIRHGRPITLCRFAAPSIPDYN